MPDRNPGLRAITTALNRLDDFAALGRSELATAPLVSRAIRTRQEADSPFDRGRVLSSLIHTEVVRSFNRCRSGPDTRDLPEWTILFLRTQEGKDLGEISQILNMPRRSIDRYYQRGKQLLLSELWTSPSIAPVGFYCLHCGTMLAGSLPGENTTVTCPRCQTLLDVWYESDGKLRLEAVTPQK